MKRKHLLWIAPWIAFGLGACATVPRTETSKACAEWRWIGIRSPQETECPEIPGWTSQPLFASRVAAPIDASRYGYEEKVRVAGDALKALDQLERFCVYETDSKLENVQLPAAANGKLVRIDQDCAAISVAGTDWQPFSTGFLAQAGKPGEPLAIRNQRGVRLAFLDTHRTGVGAPAAPPKGELTSEHGYTLAHMARNLICSPEGEDSDGCAALITTRLALPIQEFDSTSRERTTIDTEQGGSIGTQSDLAKAIRNEVDDWRGDLGREGAPQHLVLNLSVAWDGELFGGLHEEEVAELRAGTQAVYWALRYASGFDVLVLAAAGNAQACKKPLEGPLLPAAWEQGAPRETCGEAPDTPLLYAVGGVDSQGRPLANARHRGMPRRAAYGAYGVVPASTPGDSTNMYTGTSVATAIVSSIAAIVWDTLPDRDSSQIMEILDRSGDNLSALHADVRTDFWFPASTLRDGEAPPVRRLSLCTALKVACEESPGSCPLQEPWESACIPWHPETIFPNLASVPPRLSRCHPWVHTQPPDDPCPVCEPPRQ